MNLAQHITQKKSQEITQVRSGIFQHVPGNLQCFACCLSYVNNNLRGMTLETDYI